jgi:hypothetical protein
MGTAFATLQLFVVASAKKPAQKKGAALWLALYEQLRVRDRHW